MSAANSPWPKSHHSAPGDETEMQNSLNWNLGSGSRGAKVRVKRSVLTVILLVSLSVVALLLWILYVREPSGRFSDRFLFLPALNALLNALSATCLILGVRAIRRGRARVHMRFVLSACSFSVVFLISYITHHSLHGDTPFLGVWWLKTIYFTVLVSHILVAAVTFPLVLTTLYLAFTGRFHTHRKLARITFPAWLYMSITGILIFVLLKLFG